MADVHERVAAYLDDQLQTHADLAQLDELLSNIRTQHGLLQQQVSEPRSPLPRPALTPASSSKPRRMPTTPATRPTSTSTACVTSTSALSTTRPTLTVVYALSQSPTLATMPWPASSRAWPSCIHWILLRAIPSG